MNQPIPAPRPEPGHADDRLRIVIVGAGRVGSSIAYAGLISGLADSISLVDLDAARAEGEAMDLIHGLPFVPPTTIEAAGFEACRDADLVIVTAGAARQPGDTRLDLTRRNLRLMETLLPQITAHTSDALLLIVSNPVDLLTLAAQRLSGFPPERVLGTGTVLDTARLRTLLARRFDIDARNVHANVIGEHGDSEVPVWSLARIAGVRLSDFGAHIGRSWSTEDEQEISQQLRTAGAEIIRRKGATHYAIGLATLHVARALLRDERSVMTVSSMLNGDQGVSDVALSLPCILGRAGRITTIPLALDGREAAALAASAGVLREAYATAAGPA